MEVGAGGKVRATPDSHTLELGVTLVQGGAPLIYLFIWLLLFIPPQRTHLASALEEKMRLNYPKDSH